MFLIKTHLTPRRSCSWLHYANNTETNSSDSSRVKIKIILYSFPVNCCKSDSDNLSFSLNLENLLWKPWLYVKMLLSYRSSTDPTGTFRDKVRFIVILCCTRGQTARVSHISWTDVFGISVESLCHMRIWWQIYNYLNKKCINVVFIQFKLIFENVFGDQSIDDKEYFKWNICSATFCTVSLFC